MNESYGEMLLASSAAWQKTTSLAKVLSVDCAVYQIKCFGQMTLTGIIYNINSSGQEKFPQGKRCF